MSVPQSVHHLPVDLITIDFEALASHMRHCAHAQGRWFSMRSHMQHMRVLAAGRIVTMACMAVALGFGVFAFA
ncbi:hypothetical protein BH10PSE18_BH10PSE18_01900 [soil metagenome]